ncbi:MAG: (d)CMP kinase [Candidatus Latescibacterota bacterium]|nr:(d)CMP kinase [Candidatus Latescibacterota bacterium]
MPGPGGLVIAIDGVIGAGKSTTARGVAIALHYRHLDTGAMYRAVALAATAAEVAPSDHEKLSSLLGELEIELTPLDKGRRVLLNGEDVSADIRRPEITRCVGSYADRAVVRQQLVEIQRSMGAEGGIIAEGRDMSTVVFPGADLKIRMLAELEERTRRRHEEFVAGGVDITLDQVRTDIRTRDQEDEERDYGADGPPLDVVEVRTDGLSIETVIEQIVELARLRGA